MKNKIWKIKNKKSIFKTGIFEIFNLDCFLPSKKINHNFFAIHLYDWVNVFSLTNDGKVILVKQHRLGKNTVTLEVPAGAINKNETPKNAATRELEEETGYTAEKMILLKSLAVNPAIQNNTCYFYLALNCKKNKHTNFDTTEEIEVVLTKKEKIFNPNQTNIIDNSLSFLAVMLAKDYFKTRRKT